MYTGTSTNVNEPFVPGDYYLVNWDGTEYECRAKLAANSPDVYIGSDALYYNVEGNTAEPFMMLVQTVEQAVESKTGSYTATSYELLIAAEDDSVSHTVSIRHINAERKLLDEALLPVVYNGEEPIEMVDAIIALAQTVFNLTFTREPGPAVQAAVVNNGEAIVSESLAIEGR